MEIPNPLPTGQAGKHQIPLTPVFFAIWNLFIGIYATNLAYLGIKHEIACIIFWPIVRVR